MPTEGLSSSPRYHTPEWPHVFYGRGTGVPAVMLTSDLGCLWYKQDVSRAVEQLQQSDPLFRRFAGAAAGSSSGTADGEGGGGGDGAASSSS